MRRIIPIGLLAGAALAASAATAQASTIDDVVWMIQNSGGRYVPAGASLSGADCSGLVSVAQALAMGQSPRRLGNTHSLLAGNWPGVVPGASPGDRFVIGVNSGHMVAQIDGVNIESSTSGQPFRVGAGASSPWSGQYRLYHVNPALLVTARTKAPVQTAPPEVVPVGVPPPPAALPVAAPVPPPQAEPAPLPAPPVPPAELVTPAVVGSVSVGEPVQANLELTVEPPSIIPPVDPATPIVATTAWQFP